MRFTSMSRWLRLAMMVMAFGSVSVFAAACGDDEEPSSSSAETSAETTAESSADSDKPLDGKTIAYIKTGPLEYYEYSADGAEMAVQELGGEAKVFDSNLDPQKELANVQDAVTQQVDGIVLFPLTAASEKSALRVANNADIPISVLYGYAPELEDQAVGFTQVDFVSYGRELGEKFAEEVPEGDIAIITGAAGRSEVTSLDQGFREGFGGDDRIVETIDGGYARQKAFSAAQDIIAKHPDLKGLLVGNEDMAVGAIKGLGAKASQVKVAAQNGSPEGNKLLEEGKLAVTVGASPSEEAAIAVRLLAAAMSGEPAAEKICNTPYALNTPGNIQSTAWEPTPELIRAAFDVPCAGS